MFGDFERQALFDAADVSLDAFLARARKRPVFGSATNCRNTPRIARWVSMLAALDPAYSRIRRPDRVRRRERATTATTHEQLRPSRTLLGELYESGFEGRDIVILSVQARRRRDSASRAALAGPASALRPGRARATIVRYATVQAFKGLEAPVVILTDVDEIQGERPGRSSTPQPRGQPSGCTSSLRTSSRTRCST